MVTHGIEEINGSCTNTYISLSLERVNDINNQNSVCKELTIKQQCSMYLHVRLYIHVFMSGRGSHLTHRIFDTYCTCECMQNLVIWRLQSKSPN